MFSSVYPSAVYKTVSHTMRTTMDVFVQDEMMSLLDVRTCEIKCHVLFLRSSVTEFLSVILEADVQLLEVKWR